MTDPDFENSSYGNHSFLVEEEALHVGASDRFEVVDGVLKLKDGASVDHENEQSISLYITATDGGGKIIERHFDIDVVDTNEAPTGLSLEDISPIDENNFREEEYRAQQLIAQVNVSDPDLPSQDFGQHEVSVNDDRFMVQNGKLYLREGASVNFEEEQSISLTLQAVDGGGLVGDPVEFILTVSDLDDTYTLTPADDVFFG